MKNINKNYLKKIINNLFILLITANILIASGDSNTYFDRSVSYYKFLPNIVDPFYFENEGISLISEYRFRSYYTINPKSLLTQIKKDTRLGKDKSTFIIPLVASIVIRSPSLINPIGPPTIASGAS